MRQNPLLFACVAWALLLLPSYALAQQQTRSPYSEFGIGELTNTSYGRFFGMYGAGIAVADPYSVNHMNPAAWGEVRSTTLDFSLYTRTSTLQTAAQQTQFSTGGLNALAFVFSKPRTNFGVSAGLTPYSVVGFQTRRILQVFDGTANREMVSNHEGNGGLNQFHIGAGGRLKGFPKLQLGGSMQYLFGTINSTYRSGFAIAQSVSNPLGIDNFSATTIKRSSQYQSLSFKSGILFKDTLFRTKIRALDSTASKAARERYLRKRVEEGTPNFLRIGFTAEQHVWGVADREVLVTANSAGTVFGPTSTFTDTLTLRQGLSLNMPRTLGAGIALEREMRYTLALEAVYQNWADFAVDGQSRGLDNLLRITVASEWIPNRTPTNFNARFLSRIAWRLGAGYEQSYLSFGDNRIQVLGASAGMGIPLARTSMNRLNLGVQWQQRGTTADNLVQEQGYRFLLGISFSELWYSPRKYN